MTPDDDHRDEHRGAVAPPGPAAAWVVMGVSGCGKSTLGRALAERLGVPYVEGDELHPAENVRAMSEGRPLSDAMRAPWLRAVADAAEAARRGGGAVVACSALKRAYRDLLRGRVGSLGFVFLDPPREVLEARVASREDHYMPASLLQSQIDTLERPGPDEDVVRVASSGHADEALEEALAGIAARDRR